MSTTNPSAEQNLLQSLSDDLAGAVERAGPSIVRVEARRSNPASGIVWSADGLVVTAHHVLERDTNIAVVLGDGRSLTATLVGRDPGTDLALLRLPASDLPAAVRAPADAAKLGHLVLAVGRPFALAATLGVVSSVGGPWRTWRGGQVERLIQTDAPLYPGFSGGALVDAGGRIIGVASSQLGRGLNLAVPVDLAANVVQALASRGRVERAYLGVGAQGVALPASLRQRLQLAQETGLLVMTLAPDGPAERAGLLPGDILIAFDGKPVAGMDDLQLHLTGAHVGTAVTAGLIRGGDRHDVTITPAERPHPGAEAE